MKRLTINPLFIVLIALILFNSCGAPTVPIQPSVENNFITSKPFFSPSPYRQTSLSDDFITYQLQNQKVLLIYKNGNKILKDVPNIIQGEDNTCGQAVVTAILQYWGVEITYQEVVNESNRTNLPTTRNKIIRYLRDKGLKAQDYKEGTINQLIAQINKGRPTIVLLDFGGLRESHYVTVIGYNQSSKTLIIHDSLRGSYLEMAQDEFHEMWANRSLRKILPIEGLSYKNLMFQIYF